MKKQYKEIPIGGIGVIAGQRVIAQKYLPENTCDDCCFSLNAGYNLRSEEHTSELQSQR